MEVGLWDLELPLCAEGILWRFRTVHEMLCWEATHSAFAHQRGGGPSTRHPPPEDVSVLQDPAVTLFLLHSLTTVYGFSHHIDAGDPQTYVSSPDPTPEHQVPLSPSILKCLHLSLHISQVEPSVFPANLVPLLALPIWLTSFIMALTSEVRSPGVIPDTSASSVCHVQLLPHSVSWPCANSSFLCTVMPHAAPAAGLNHHLPLPWAPSFWPLPAGVQS